MEASTSSALVQKINHKLPEVRKRAVESLNSKLQNGIASPEKLVRETNVCQEILQLFDESKLLTECELELLELFLASRESFICLYVLGIEEKVRTYTEKLDADSKLLSRLHKVLATILSTSREFRDTDKESLAFQLVPRLPSFSKDREITLKLDEASFRLLPKLQSVNLDRETEQTLFEISFRLEHSNHEIALLASIEELCQCVCRDVPCQAILQQKSLFDNLLRLLNLHTKENLFGSALSTLHRIFVGFKENVKLSDSKDILTHEEGDAKSETVLYLERSYPKPLYIPEVKTAVEFQESVVDVAPHTHMAILHLLRLLGDTKVHFQVTKPIFSALDLLGYLGEKSRNNACLDRCISMYLGEVEKIFDKHSTSWKALQEEGVTNREPLQISVFDVNLTYIAIQVLKLRSKSEASKLVPQKLQVYFGRIFSNECIGMCLPDLSAHLFPLIQEIDPNLTLKKTKSKEVMKSFLTLSRDLKALRPTSTNAKADNMKTIRIIIDLLPTVIGMGESAYFDHIFQIIIHLLMRSDWNFVGDEAPKPDFYVALQKAILTILSKGCMEIKVRAYQMWLEAIKACGAEQASAIFDPLSNKSIMSVLIVYGLRDKETKEDVAQILFYACKSKSTRTFVRDWLIWIDSYRSDTQIGQVINSMLIVLNESQAVDKDKISWLRWRYLICSTFSNDKSERKKALDFIFGFLQEKDYGKNLKKFSFLLSSFDYEFSMLNCLGLVQDAGEHEIQSLVSIFTNEKIEVSIQKSSAMQLLLALTRSQRTKEISREMLDMCLSIVFKCTSPDFLDYDEEFLLSVLQILAFSMKGNDDAVIWFAKQSEVLFLTLSMLLFHSSISVQQTVAVILFSVIFSEERLRLFSSGLTFESKKGNGGFFIADNFEDYIRPPFSCSFDEVGFGDGAVNLIEEIATKVKDTINTRNAMKALLSGGSLLQSDLPKDICDMVETLHPQFVLENTLERMKNATSHEECESWLLLLLNFCSCNLEALKELAAMNWFKYFRTFLSSKPSSRKDWDLWSLIFATISRMLEKCTLPHSILMNLVLLCDEAVLPTIFHEEYWEPVSRMKIGVKVQLQLSQASSMRKKFATTKAVYSALEMIVNLLRAKRASGNIGVQKYMIETLATEETINALSDFVVCDSWDYGLRNLTMECLVELLVCFLDLKALDVFRYTPGDTNTGFSAIVPKIIKNICLTLPSLPNGKSLTKLSLEYLKQVTNLQRESWTSVWAETDCTFWLSKLLRDQETLARKTSLQVLCALSNPVSAPLISMLNKCWPDRLYTIVKVAFDDRECDVVRAKAMKVISLSLAWERISSKLELVSESYPTKSSVRKNIYQTLEEQKFWYLLKNSLLWNRSHLMGGLLSIVAEMLVSDMEYVFENCNIGQICKVATAIFNSCSKHLDSRLDSHENDFETVIPMSMALNILQILLQKEKLFSRVLNWIPSMNICKIFCSFSVKISSILKEDFPFRVSYYSACLPLLQQFSAVIANLMHAVFNSNYPVMTEEEEQSSIIEVADALRSLLGCQILPVKIKCQCCKLLEITLQNEDAARMALNHADDSIKEKEPIGSALCNHLVADMRSMSKNIKMGLSARRRSVLQLNSNVHATTLAMRGLLACSNSAKASMVRNKYYQDLMMEFRVHSNAIVAASLHKKKDLAMVAKSASKLLHVLLLLKHFSYKSKICSDVLTQEGAVQLIRTQFDVPKGSAQVQNGALGLLVNLAANSSLACLEIFDTKVQTKSERSASFFLELIGMWASRKTIPPITRLCGHVIQALLQVQESRTAILKTDFVSRMVSLLEKLLKKRDCNKIYRTLKFFTDLAAFRDSRMILLHHALFSDLIEFILSVKKLDSNQKAMEEVVLFLRNMSFSQDMKTYLSSKHEALHLLLQQIYNFTKSPRMASFASSSLWALLYKSQKMKACIRNLNNTIERLFDAEAELLVYCRNLDADSTGSDVNYINETHHHLHQITKILSKGESGEFNSSGGSPVSILGPVLEE